MRVGAERAAAIGHDLMPARQLGEPALELVERNRARPVDMPRGVLRLGSYVDEDDVTPGHSRHELVAADGLDLAAEVLTRRALDLGQPGRRRLTQRQPDPQRLVPRQR